MRQTRRYPHTSDELGKVTCGECDADPKVYPNFRAWLGAYMRFRRQLSAETESAEFCHRLKP